MHKLLKTYLKRLTNLTANNRSLLLLRLPVEQFIDINEFHFITQNGAFGIIENLIGSKKIKLAPLSDSRDEDTNIVSKRLKRLQRADRFITEERGSNDLYVGWPFVRGKFNDSSLVRCPLLFFPVSIEVVNNHWCLIPRAEGVMLNKSFLLAYSYFNGIKLEDDFIDRGFEDFDNDDSTVFRTALYQLLKDSPVELNFNPDNFRDELISFQSYKKDEFDQQEKTGELKLFPEAVLGIFPQAGSYLVPDYQNLIQNTNIKDIEDFFASRTLNEKETEIFSKQNSFLNTVTEEKTFTPFKMDAHQENAIKAIKNGKSIVVQGPPGTGKSQLICNLMADHMAEGKKVLVVCQKRAALDVVYERMKEKDLTDFLGLVHDFRHDRKSIYQKIGKQIDRLDEYKMRNNGLDAIQLERNFLQNCRRVDQITEELEEFKFALFDESECDLSVKELYMTSDIDAPAINIKQEYTNFRFSDLPDFVTRLRGYLQYANTFDKSEYPWADRRSFSDFAVSDQRQILDVLEDIPTFQEKLAVETKKIVGQSLDFESCEALITKRDFIVEMLGILKDDLAYEFFQHMVSYSDNETSSLWLSNTERVLMECYKGEGPETSLPTEQLGKFQEVLQRSMDARKSLIRLLHWSLFSKDKFFIKRVLVENGLKRNKQGFRTMVEKVDNRLNLEHNLTKIKQKEWIKHVPETYEKGLLQNWFYVIKLSVKAKLIFNSLRNLKEYFNIQKLSYQEFREKLETLYLSIQDVPLKKQVWLNYLSNTQITNVLNNGEHLEKLRQSIRKDFDALCEFDKIKATMTPHEDVVIQKLLDQLDDHNHEQLEQVFQNSLRLAWIEHIETKYPVLRSVSSLKFQQLEAELQNCVRNKLEVSNEMLLLRAREQTYEYVEYNRLNNMVTYRDLYHQVTKKKRIWPIRKVINNFHHELFNLVPCWLASPESVSAIFPMTELFDLVIFDEASQCFVERGIPAMYRGRQVLIAGDDKQLQPNDLYQVRYEEDEEDQGVALEVDSLLQLASHQLKTVQLKGHYRSKSLELIDFSNKYFYNGNLKLLPDHDIVNTKIPAIEYIKVDGIWEKNTNNIEAEKVVDLLLLILDNEPNKSVGVVTFNARQQQHILDVIDVRFTAEKQTFPNTWFVKNIENVQGDEKDIIIFSTAYAPDPSGRMIMQFGSLNAANGENRLNVAITRAKEKIVIISSIYPQQLKVEETKNEGPKLLKQYLEYAMSVSEGQFIPTLPPKTRHQADWYLKTKLIAWSKENLQHYTFDEEMPFADLTVRQNNHYLGLILTDDDLYFQSLSIKDIHVYTPFTLSKKNWKFKGIFSREYWNDKERVEESINRFLSHHQVEA